MAKKNIVYRKNPSTGEIEYPVTSSAAVGMSDGSGNLDNKLTELATKEELNTKLDTVTYNSEKTNFATKTELNTKLNTSTYNTDKATFATKKEIGDINTILDTINGEVI